MAYRTYGPSWDSRAQTVGLMSRRFYSNTIYALRLGVTGRIILHQILQVSRRIVTVANAVGHHWHYVEPCSGVMVPSEPRRVSRTHTRENARLFHGMSCDETTIPGSSHSLYYHFVERSLLSAIRGTSRILLVLFSKVVPKQRAVREGENSNSRCGCPSGQDHCRSIGSFKAHLKVSTSFPQSHLKKATGSDRW